MDPLVIGILGLAGIFLLIALHVPIGVALAMAGLISFAVLQSLEVGITLFGSEPARLMANPDIGVIPLFLLMSFYSPGIPSGGLLIMTPLYVSLNLPVEGIGILIALDQIVDMFLTPANVTANLTVATMLTRSERKSREQEPSQD